LARDLKVVGRKCGWSFMMDELGEYGM